VLLAVTVFAVVLTAIHAVFYGAVRLRNKTTAAVEATVPLQQTLAIMKRDWANLVMPGGTLFGQLQTSPSTSTSTNTQGQTQPNTTPLLDSTRLQVTPYIYTATAQLEEDLPWGEVQKVGYFLAQSTNHSVGKDLVRTVTRNLLPVMEDQAEDQFLLGGVEELMVSFYDGTQWRDYWDSTTETNKLPQAIKIQLQLAAEDPHQELPPPIQLVVPVILTSATNQTAQSETSSGGGQ
jgi:type II secretion system protein J